MRRGQHFYIFSSSHNLSLLIRKHYINQVRNKNILYARSVCFKSVKGHERQEKDQLSGSKDTRRYEPQMQCAILDWILFRMLLC